MNFELGVANSSSGKAHDLISSLGSGDLYSLIAGVSSVLLNRPGRWSPTFAYMWVDRNGRPVSPPSTHPRSPTFKKVMHTFWHTMFSYDHDTQWSSSRARGHRVMRTR
ncbi:uncharacterized protein TNIN_498631 [Trichonephila inaurata madagascariensis]|uniref:Uncharacterized protein n=1 Tax=Trichonephila inaurata madagascariensis TaxID=2747483 RepID=A0A8X7CS64_9ARAC|nr:uncharacterized protein TNIN_498631 [Trichonephila inaurata madagascariensis]